MLPGGLDVLGIFALAPPNMMISAQTKLRQVSLLVSSYSSTPCKFGWIKKSGNHYCQIL